MTSNVAESNNRLTGWTPTDLTQNMATGGEIESTNGWRTHFFLSGTQTFVPQYSGVVEVLVVGGGGGGGSGMASGGGAGGLIYNGAYPVKANTSYTVVIGAGGAGGANAANETGFSGSNSQFGSLTAYGGGGGGHEGAVGKSGGSGGGGPG